ncbi:hypothetical protein ABIA61_002808 [Paenibacillus sp. RC21]
MCSNRCLNNKGTCIVRKYLSSLKASSQLNDKAYYIKSITLLFEKYKDHSTEEQRTEYEKVIKAVENNINQMTS